MTNQQILEKAIAKAIDGGWLGTQDSSHVDWLKSINYYKDIQWITTDEFYPVIFNHEFCKALWGEELQTDYYVVFPDGEDYGKMWQYHLQQMVIAPNPIKYLGENLDG